MQQSAVHAQDASGSGRAGVLSPTRMKPRLQALAIRAAVGVVILAPLVWYVLRWYPGSLFWVDGGRQGLQILIGVDLVLGPLLTFLVFDVAKSRGKIVFDLCVIAVLEVAALAWGMHAIHAQRPVALVLGEGKFMPVETDTVTRQGGDVAALQRMHAHRPPLIFSLPPRDKDDFAQAFLITMNEGLDLHQQVSRMRPLEANMEAARLQAVDVAARDDAAALRSQLDALADSSAAARASLAVFVLSGRYGDALIVLDGEGRLVGTLEPGPA